MSRRGLSQADARRVEIGAFVESLPDDVQGLLLGLLAPAVMEWHPERCAGCGGLLEGLRTGCVDTTDAGDVLRVRVMHPACADTERDEHGYIERHVH